MRTALRLAFAYFAITFALGFVLGTIRVLWIAPAWGETAAVIAELPLMLAASWIAARALLRGRALATAGRAAMGALAFALLIGAEAALGVFAFGQPLAEWAAALFKAPGAIGLAGQAAFGIMPVVAGRRDESPAGPGTGG